MGRLSLVIYGLLAYAVGMIGLVWFVLYVGGWDFLPRNIDTQGSVSLLFAASVNFLLMLLFGVQHSVMARPSFKRQWTKVIPQAAERSTYILLTGVLLCLFCILWQPIAGYVWRIDNEIGQAILLGGYFLGWFLVVLTTFLINHFELFGLQQVYCHFKRKPEPAPTFKETLLYKIVRHPLQLGVLLGLWSTPLMSMTHLMLSALMSIYIFIGLYYEERDLLKSLGSDYASYKERVRMIVPFPK